jgi:hypothetical protein
MHFTSNKLPYLIRVWEIEIKPILINSLKTYRKGYSSTCMWVIEQWCSPISRDQGQQWGEAGEILNGDVTYPGPAQVLVYMPGPG